MKTNITNRNGQAGTPGYGYKGNSQVDTSLARTRPPRHHAAIRASGCTLDNEIARLLATLKPAGSIHGKPVFIVPASTVLNLGSGFRHKLLCDGLTFTGGTACVYSCKFCYVIAIVRKNKWVQAAMRQTGLDFRDIIIRREDPVGKLRKSLMSRGKPKYRRSRR